MQINSRLLLGPVMCLLFACFMAGSVTAQVLEPSKWSFSLSKSNVKIGEETEVVVRVQIEDTWYLYSSDFDPDLGPTVTTFTFKPSSDYKVIGTPKPIGAKKKFDDVFGGEVRYFKHQAEFRQKIKITGKNPVINGSYEGQVCTETNGRCVPVSGDFTLQAKVMAAATLPESLPAKAEAAPANKLPEPTLAQTKTDAQAHEPQTDEPDSATGAASVPVTAAGDKAAPEQAGITASPDTLARAADGGAASNGESTSLLSFMLAAFLAGLVALLTPCVYPMIPMTVSYFTRNVPNRATGIKMALFYGASIIAVYTLIGTVVSRFNGPEFANFRSTHWIPNLLFFIVFVVFGLSFLGMFEIELPSNWVNKADRQADKGGYYGIFFMAFTLALISFSCTGPFVGSILVQSAGGAVIKPIVGMLGFSLAFALPFTLFAIFPGALHSLPRSGGWLNSVKVVLGFLELALALKFLSIADQAYHWHILDREVFISLWVVIFSMIGFYLIGKIQLPNDSPVTVVSVPKLALSLIAFSFVIYLLPGMFGAPLKALAGYLPPQNTIDFDLSDGSLGRNTKPQATGSLCSESVKYGSFLELPHNLQGYFDYKQALACAKERNKPVFIDFTGHGCVNCREMEARVWSDPRVLSRLRNNYVIAALYVDDKTELPEKEWFTSRYDGKEKTTIGKQNADLEISRFNNNAQPLYVLLNPDGKLIAPPRADDLDADAFLRFLENGLNDFNSIGSNKN